MRESIVEFSFRAYSLLLPYAEIALLAFVVVLLPMSMIRRTRSTAGTWMYLASMLFGLTTWLLGAGVTFGTFGWVGLFVGLAFLGIGVVPLGAYGAFARMGEPSLGIALIVMAVITFGARILGAILSESDSGVA